MHQASTEALVALMVHRMHPTAQALLEMKHKFHIGLDFVYSQSCRKRRKAGYVSIATRAKTEKQASENTQVI